MKRIKRILNIRPLLFIAVAMIVGVIVGEAMYNEHLAYISIPLCLGGAAIVTLAVVKRLRKFIYIPVALLVGFASIMISNAVYDSNFVKNRYSENITLTVTGEILINDGVARFYATDVYADGEKLKGDAYVTLNYVENLDYAAGDVICLIGYVGSVEHKKFDKGYAACVSNRRTLSVYSFVSYKLSEGELDFPYSLQMQIKKMYYDNTDRDTASLLNGLMLGDTFLMEDSLRERISYAGLAHILAVSGLHISTLSGALYYLLKKLKVNKQLAFGIVSVITLFYSYLCSFTASSLRACIMCAVFSISDAFGKKNDPLSTLSFAAALILLFRPTALFSMGFLLSFSCVLGIFLFYKDFERFNMRIVDKLSPKRHFGKRVARSIALSTAVTAGSFPFIALLVGRFSLIYWLSNLLILPYIMVMYVVQLALTVFALVTTLSVVTVALKYLYIPVLAYLAIIARIPYLLANVSFNLTGALLYEGTAFYVSRFCFVSRRTKLLSVLAVTPLFCLIGLLPLALA